MYTSHRGRLRRIRPCQSPPPCVPIRVRCSLSRDPKSAPFLRWEVPGRQLFRRANLEDTLRLLGISQVEKAGLTEALAKRLQIARSREIHSGQLCSCHHPLNLAIGIPLWDIGAKIGHHGNLAIPSAPSRSPQSAGEGSSERRARLKGVRAFSVRTSGPGGIHS